MDLEKLEQKIIFRINLANNRYKNKVINKKQRNNEIIDILYALADITLLVEKMKMSKKMLKRIIATLDILKNRCWGVIENS